MANTVVFGANTVVIGSKNSETLGTYSGYLGKCSDIGGQIHQYLVKHTVIFGKFGVI